MTENNDPKTGHFSKGNTLWQKGLEVKKDRRAKIEEFFLVMQIGGQSKYVELQDALSKGIEITKEEREFMDRAERLWPYVQPKLSSKQVTGKDGGPIELSVSKLEEIEKALDDF